MSWACSWRIGATTSSRLSGRLCCENVSRRLRSEKSKERAQTLTAAEQKVGFDTLYRGLAVERTGATAPEGSGWNAARNRRAHASFGLFVPTQWHIAGVGDFLDHRAAVRIWTRLAAGFSRGTAGFPCFSALSTHSTMAIVSCRSPR
jgi:hypothetical protein